MPILAQPPSAAGEFAVYARSLMQYRGDVFTAAHELEAGGRTPQRVVEILKAASLAGTTTDIDWASGLVGYKIAEAAFVETLKHYGAFDAMLPSMKLVPFNTRVVYVLATAVGASVGEAVAKPVSSMSLSAGDLVPGKVSCIVVLSAELVKLGAGQNLVLRALQQGVAAASDTAFLTAAAAGVTPVPATANVLDDLKAAAAGMDIGANSRLYLIAPGEVITGLSLTDAGDGRPAFPDLTSSGGSVGGIVVVPSDAAGSDAFLIDSSQIVVAVQPVVLDSSTHTSLEMADSALTGVAGHSLWALNEVALRAERALAARGNGARSTAVIADVAAWTA